MAGHKFDRFREIKIIGAGAFGKTVLVEDQTQGSRRVVIKVPLTEETETALINDLINNAVLQTSLKEMSHANIAHYLGFDRYDGRFVMILEYVKGRDLRKILGPAQSQSRPPMDLGLALRIAVDVCSGLVAAHAARVFHSDIKPENILVRDEDGVAKICDFGISQIMRSTAATETGGTVPYMAPEALGGKASFPADLWSLSVTLYEMATGALPFAFPQGCDIFAFNKQGSCMTEEPIGTAEKAQSENQRRVERSDYAWSRKEPRPPVSQSAGHAGRARGVPARRRPNHDLLSTNRELREYADVQQLSAHSFRKLFEAETDAHRRRCIAEVSAESGNLPDVG